MEAPEATIPTVVVEGDWTTEIQSLLRLRLPWTITTTEGWFIRNGLDNDTMTVTEPTTVAGVAVMKVPILGTNLLSQNQSGERQLTQLAATRITTMQLQGRRNGER